MANGIGNAVGVRHTETSLIIWSTVPNGIEDGIQTAKIKKPVLTEAPIFNAERFYDAGDKGCADGPMDEIAAMIRQMDQGQRLEIFALDATVPVDLAAWCRMTGNPLVEQQGFHFLVQHK